MTVTYRPKTETECQFRTLQRRITQSIPQTDSIKQWKPYKFGNLKDKIWVIHDLLVLLKRIIEEFVEKGEDLSRRGGMAAVLK